jgi:hypothetical protein
MSASFDDEEDGFDENFDDWDEAEWSDCMLRLEDAFVAS